MKKWDAGKEEERKIASRSPKMLEETASRQECEDTNEMVQWRSVCQQGIDGLWRELCGTTEEEVLEKYKVDGAKKGAHRGRGEPLDWRIVKKEKRYQSPNVGEDCWAILMVQRMLSSA